MSGAGREPGWVRGTFAAIFAIAALVIYLPIAVMFVFSFNSGRYQVMPFRDFTLQWYERLLVDPQYMSGLANSVLIAGAVSVTATGIAFACAYSLVNARFPGKTAPTLFVLAPLAVPLVLIGISLRLYFVSLGLEPSLWLVYFGQTLFVLPLAILNLRNRIAQIPRSHEEAAWALGASRLRAIVEIVLPSCRFAVVATLIITFTFAFDEFVIAYFLTNFEITLPMLIDESFSGVVFAEDKWRESTCSVYERLVVVNSFSKSHHLQGLRVGMCAAQGQLFEDIVSAHQTAASTASSLSQAAVLALLDAGGGLPDYGREREMAIGFVRDPGWDCCPSDGSFHVFPRTDGIDAFEATGSAHNVFMPRGEVFGSACVDHVRLCFGKPAAELERIFALLRGSRSTILERSAK